MNPGPRKPGGGPPRTSAPHAPPRVAAPSLSVVVASNRDRSLLEACLASLVDQCRRENAELIVARSGLTPDATALRRAFPSVLFVNAPDDASIPQLRGIGMTEASGDIVALTEDHCLAHPDWLQTLARHVGDGADVIGGGMDNAQRTRLVDWGAYFAEYGFFAPSRKSGEHESPLLTGANVAYSRRVVEEVIALARENQWENVAHGRLRARGSILRFVSTAEISQNQQYSFWPFCADRYVHGRDYARKRLSEEKVNRWALLAGSPLLPFLLTWRVARAATKGRTGTFVRALPATFAFLASWSIGEAAGYLRGPVRDRE
ncbi:MAG: glycosyltransferase [Gemmatimonadaceae bacterium]